MTAVAPLTVEPSPRNNNGFRSDIQGLRAVAVLLVVTYHCAPSVLPGGYIGVDVFFVISGFLITAHLLEGLQREGSISLPGFYARRALRILPAAFAVLVLTTVAAMIWVPPLQHDDVFLWAVAAALYVPNMLAGLLSTDYLAESAPSVFQHYWSLGIEEQFYLVWPVVLILGWRTLGRSESALLKLAGILVAGSFVLGLIVLQFSQPWAFFSLPTRAWELASGGLLAFVMRRRPVRPARTDVGIMAWFGLTGLLIAALVYDSETPFPGYHAAVPVVATALLIMGGTTWMGPSRLLSVRPLQFVGLISYSFYLVHWPLLVIPQAAVGYAHPLPLWVRLSLGALGIPLAYLLYRFVEDPARRARPLARMAPVRTLLLAVAVTVLVSVLAAVGSAVHQRLPLDAGRPTSSAQLSPFPAGTEFVPSNLVPSLRKSAEDTPLVYENGCDTSIRRVDPSGCQFGTNPDAPVVAVFGDSHAASWFPALHALAREGIIQLDTSTMGTCPSANAPTPLEPSFEARCRQWRADVVRRLRDKQPQVVLLANHAARYEPAADATFPERWAQGLAETIDALPDASRVGVLADVPDMLESPAICLSAHLEDAGACGLSRSVALDTELFAAEKATTDAVGATYLDLTDYFCGPTTCPPIIGNLLTHRDGDHLTATFSEALASPLGRKLEPLLRK